MVPEIIAEVQITYSSKVKASESFALQDPKIQIRLFAQYGQPMTTLNFATS
jgi:hypothetical protein